jgi:hypothetical protein
MSRKDQIRLVCLLLFIFGACAILFTDNRVIETSRAFSGGPPAGHTGAPGELTCSTSGCHTGSVNGGPGRLTIIGPTTYEPGETYEITVRHTTTDSSRRRWGFQLTALTAGNRKAGDIERRNNLTSVLDDDGPGFNRQYIEHSITGTFQGQTSQASWTFDWVAPSSDVGPVIFYAAGNQSNNDGTNNGDQIYSAMDIVLSGPPEITGARIEGKKLIVEGKNFDLGATLLLNDQKQKKTSNVASDPTGEILAKKSGKKIARGQTVMLQVKNPDDTASQMFSFTRPL